MALERTYRPVENEQGKKSWSEPSTVTAKALELSVTGELPVINALTPEYTIDLMRREENSSHPRVS